MKNSTHSELDPENQDEGTAENPAFEGQEEAQRGKTSPDPLKKLQDELAEAKEKYIRLYAEFDNYRRRTAKEKLDMISSATEGLIKQLLPVLDDLERGEKSFTDKTSKEAEGFFLIQNKFKKILEQAGVKAMDTAAGSDFNPDLHEAITQIPAPSENLKGKVVDVVDKGYLLSEKVIRFAKVVVGN